MSSWEPLSRWGRLRARERATQREIDRLVAQRRRKRLQEQLPPLDDVRPFPVEQPRFSGWETDRDYEARQRRRRVDALIEKHGLRSKQRPSSAFRLH
jgi:hypothetical protein